MTWREANAKTELLNAAGKKRETLQRQRAHVHRPLVRLKGPAALLRPRVAVSPDLAVVAFFVHSDHVAYAGCRSELSIEACNPPRRARGPFINVATCRGIHKATVCAHWSRYTWVPQWALFCRTTGGSLIYFRTFPIPA